MAKKWLAKEIEYKHVQSGCRQVFLLQRKANINMSNPDVDNLCRGCLNSFVSVRGICHKHKSGLGLCVLDTLRANRSQNISSYLPWNV